ncbi:MAG: hypothetical protein EA351_13730 [Gemmatimonadales bacterium]|nr:MAG: hypothetical protein EA351_13730 [Gemmatimonadales bacterium]
MGHAPPFELKLFGRPEIRDATGAPVGLPAGKPLALLIYLHLSDSPVSRDQLAGLLWSGSTRDRARGSVRHALWYLRKELGEDLFAQDDPVALTPGRVRSDLQQFRSHLSAGRLAEATRLWSGSPPELAELADGVEWSHWCETVRLSIEREFAAALTDQAATEREQGKPQAAIRWLRVATTIQPGRLGAHLDLIETHLDLRNFDEASRALQEAREHLSDPDSIAELEPLERRLDLLQRGSPVSELDDPALRLEFTGRDDEFNALLRRWRQAREGEPGIGLVTGEPGIGKTRLSEEIAAVVKAEGGRVIQLKADDSERPIEWGLLSEAIQRLLNLSGAAGISHASDGVLRTLVPSLSLTDPSGPGAPDRTGPYLPRSRPSAALSDALIDLMSAVSEDAPLLLVVDDLQWADTESRSVLARVATRLSEVSVFLLFNCRAEVDSARVRKTLALLADGPRTTSIELTPWSEADVSRLLQARIRFSGRGSRDAIIGRIHRTTRGNPLFVVELLKAFEEEGTLEGTAEGVWIFHTDRLPPDLPLPRSLRDLVDRQLDQLSEEAKLVAAHLARIGHPTSPRMLALRTGLGTSAVTSGVGDLLNRRMIRWETPDTLTFLHDELRSAVARRFQLHVGLTTGGGAQWSFFRTAVVASVALLMLGAVAYVFARPAPSSPSLFGGGMLVLTRDAGVESFRVEISEIDGGLEMVRQNPSFSPPETAESGGPVRLVSGAVEWVPKDLLGLSPDGMHQLVHRELDDERHQLVLQNLEKGDGVTIYEGRRSPEQVDVSPLGQRILVLLPGRTDALVVMTPGGRPLARWTSAGILRSHWCGPDRVLILVREDHEVHAHLWNPAQDSLERLRLMDLHLGGQTACSPDGSAIVLQGALEGRVGMYLHQLDRGSTVPLPLPPGGAPERIHWIPDEVAPLPSGIRIASPKKVTLAWGDQYRLQGRLLFPDGSAREDSLQWVSRDREIAFIAQDGQITAASPGESWIIAEWNGWLRDSVRIEVSPSESPGTLVRETFEDPRLPGWLAPGSAGPRWQPRGRPGSLRFTGPDDRLAALISESGVWLPDGGTLELEFRLPLSRAEGQSLALCLFQMGSSKLASFAEDGLEAFSGFRSGVRQSACARYPSGTGDQWDPRRIELHSHRSFPATPIDVSPSLPREEWTHLAISVGADGAVSTFIDREWIGSTPVFLDPDPTGWRIAILGKAMDTELEIRHLTLWPGLRYDPSARP